MNEMMTVMDHEITPHNYRNQPVLTLRQIDAVHQRTEDRAGRNFRQNREHFIEGTDFFSLPYEEWTELLNRRISPDQVDDELGDLYLHLEENGEVFAREEENLVRRNSPDQDGEVSPQYGGHRGNMIFVTQTGYLMLVKSYTDALAWQVQRVLVNSYFNQRVPEEHTIIHKDKLIKLLEGRAELAEMKLGGYVVKRRWLPLEMKKAQQLRTEGYSYIEIGNRLGRGKEAVRQLFLRMVEEAEE